MSLSILSILTNCKLFCNRYNFDTCLQVMIFFFFVIIITRIWVMQIVFLTSQRVYVYITSIGAISAVVFIINYPKILSLLLLLSLLLSVQLSVFSYYRWVCKSMSYMYTHICEYVHMYGSIIPGNSEYVAFLLSIS